MRMKEIKMIKKIVVYFKKSIYFYLTFFNNKFSYYERT